MGPADRKPFSVRHFRTRRFRMSLVLRAARACPCSARRALPRRRRPRPIDARRHHPPQRAASAASTAAPAVSVRSTRGPSDSAAKPRARAACSSSGASPPSGPISSVTSPAGGAAGSDANGTLARGDSSKRSSPSAGVAGSASSHASKPRTGAISGKRLRPHCSHDARTTPRQCDTRLSARSPDSLTTPRAVDSGATAATPSSTAFSITQSILSPPAMPCASVTRYGGSASAGSNASIRASAPRLSISTSRARYWPPVPSNSASASPGCSRSTCA
ncbi:conserved domain protein [Burkholderia pseudomallei 1710b]|uniref:Conserved domain protein n=1 Tax=Burkholderia pseudomallei (strain 1710b) TaxID=320372 RepID=Q3JNL1_BURP1|nr:conserved domain protein [Burkholderia pseudomallei 1710b]